MADYQRTTQKQVKTLSTVQGILNHKVDEGQHIKFSGSQTYTKIGSGFQRSTPSGEPQPKLNKAEKKRLKRERHRNVSTN